MQNLKLNFLRSRIPSAAYRENTGQLSGVHINNPSSRGASNGDHMDAAYGLRMQSEDPVLSTGSFSL